MITKKHLVEHLKELSGGIRASKGEMPPHIWHKFLEYLVDHYKRFNKEARTYADETFDQVEAALERTIDRLPQGLRKDVLRQKLARVRGERSPLPVLYLDTPVLESVIQHGFGQPVGKSAKENAKTLYETIPALVKNQKLVYAEDNFHRETLLMGGDQARKAMAMIRTFSDGMSFKHPQSIEDYQIFRAVRAFIRGNATNYRHFWQDAFQAETLHAIMKNCPFVFFEEMLALPETPRGNKVQAEGPGPFVTRLRIRYDKNAQNNDRKLQKRSTRHLRDLVRLGMRYQTVSKGRSEQVLDGFWASQKTDMAVAVWNYYGGKPEGLEGLVSFYESEHFSDVPSIKIKQDIWNAHVEHDKENQRQITAPADISILSTVIPYTDILILTPDMTKVVRDKLGLDARFDVKIYASDEHEQISAALESLAHAHTG